jgi:sugar-specific transcriptional regulator TrmB
MAYVFGFNLSHQSERILKTLLIYRGMTAKQLTGFLFGPLQHSLSEEKSVYNYLRKLRGQGLVTA